VRAIERVSLGQTWHIRDDVVEAALVVAVEVALVAPTYTTYIHTYPHNRKI